jgi:hypothetical protein
VVPTKAEPSGRRAASSRSAGSSWTPGTGSYAARANASCARTASPTARDSKPAYRASVTDRRPCPLRAACIGSEVPRRAILLHRDHPALPRARRKHARWGERERSIHARHRIRAEGFHGEAKTWHGLARAVRRGLANVRIQAYLTAAVITLKRLAAALVTLLLAVLLATGPMLARQRT